MNKRVIQESEYDKIVELYNNGNSSVQIGKMYGCDHKQLQKF